MKKKIIICALLIVAVIALSTIVLDIHEERKAVNNAGQNDGTTVEQIDDVEGAASQEEGKTDSDESTNAAGQANKPAGEQDGKQDSKQDSTTQENPKNIELPEAKIF